MNLGDCPTIEGTNQTKVVYDLLYLPCLHSNWLSALFNIYATQSQDCCRDNF
jgi:hypothetical protein